MNEDFVTMSIRCQQCLTWSLDDANFCHRCGADLGPWFEAIHPNLDNWSVCVTQGVDHENRYHRHRSARTVG